MVVLYFLNESGFAPTLPLRSTWAREKSRPSIAYQTPEGRRVNTSGALQNGQQPRLAQITTAGKVDSALFVRFMWRE